MREAQEIKRLGFTQSPRPPVLSRKPAKLDQARLVRVPLQRELREPLAKLSQEPPRILLILKPHDEVVRETHDDHITVCMTTSPPVGPQVEDIVQIDVR